MLTLAGTQAATDNPLEAALGQATKEEAKLPAPGLAIEPVCTRPDAAMNPVKPDIPTANTPVRTDAGNDKMMPLGAAVAGTKVLVQVAGMTQAVSSDTSMPTSKILEDSCLSNEHAPHVKFPTNITGSRNETALTALGATGGRGRLGQYHIRTIVVET